MRLRALTKRCNRHYRNAPQKQFGRKRRFSALTTWTVIQHYQRLGRMAECFKAPVLKCVGYRYVKLCRMMFGTELQALPCPVMMPDDAPFYPVSGRLGPKLSPILPHEGWIVVDNSEPIPADLREAFDQAVVALIAWDSGQEPTVSVHGKPTL